jgi:hypothetical protein
VGVSFALALAVGVHAGSDVVVLELCIKKSNEGNRRGRNYFVGNKVVLLEPIALFVSPLKAPARNTTAAAARGAGGNY